MDLTIGLALWIISLGARGGEEDKTPGNPVQECMDRHHEWSRETLNRLARNATTTITTRTTKPSHIPHPGT